MWCTGLVAAEHYSRGFSRMDTDHESPRIFADDTDCSGRLPRIFADDTDRSGERWMYAGIPSGSRTEGCSFCFPAESNVAEGERFGVAAILKNTAHGRSASLEHY